MKRLALVVFALVLASCSSSASDDASAATDKAEEILGGVKEDLDPVAVEPEVDPPAYQPDWMPEGFEITRASAASPEFMSIEITGPIGAEEAAADEERAETASLIWGDELADFEVLAQTDPDGTAITLRGSDATLFTFGSDQESIGPAVIWEEPSGIPVVVIGSSGLSSEDVVAIAEGISEITQQEFLDLAIALAESRLNEVDLSDE